MFQIQDRRARRTEPGPLKGRWQKSRSPVARSVLGRTKWIIQHNVGRQVLVFGTQPVDRPRAERRITHEQATAVNFVQGVVVVGMVGPHRIDETNIIRHL